MKVLLTEDDDKLRTERKRQIFLRIFYFPGFLYNCR